MADALPILALHDQRIRHAQIRDRLRIIGVRHALPVDSMYVRGDLWVEQWTDTHQFRADQIVFADMRSNGHIRGPLPDDAPARKGSGYTMLGIEIVRANRCKKRMDPDYYAVARIITGLETGEYEHAQALRAIWQLQQVYRYGDDTERWREYG